MCAERTVLIIDDEADAADALATIVRDWGADVTVGKSASELASQLGPQLSEVGWIITDYHLGSGCDGLASVQEVAARAPRARILVLSASLSRREAMAAADAGFDTMEKPARAEKIVSWLERQ